MATANLLMDQGATFQAVVECTKENQTPFDLRGWSVRSVMKKTHKTDTIIATFTASHDGRGGKITLALTSAQTEDIDAGTYLYDVELYDTAIPPSVTRIIEGTVTVTPEVTR